MSTQTGVLLIIGLVVLVLSIMILARLLEGGGRSTGSKSRGLRGSLDEYRQEVRDIIADDGQADSFVDGKSEDDWQQSVEAEPDRVRGVTLAMRLRFANLSWMPPYVVSLLQILVSLVAFAAAYVYLRLPLQITASCMGPLIVNWWINRRIRNRVQRFDADFSHFLLSVVGMLKTGLNPIQALESAAEGLEDDSSVRLEVELMLERVRMGVSEDRSIGSFGEDIDQPEIELFVQALLLSRRLGGTLSETLDRLAKQVRKRQTFKIAANGAVSMQRGSIYSIIVVIALVQVYMYVVAPDMVVGAWSHPKLAGYAQCSIVIIFIAMLYVNKVTKIKV